MEWITPDQYRPGTIAMADRQKRHRGNQRRRGCKWSYKDLIITFDVETTRLHGGVDPMFSSQIRRYGHTVDTGANEQAVMYIWMLHIHHHCTIVGRTWEEYEILMGRIRAELEDDERLVIWVHNLSYEFQFLRAVHEWETEEVFAIDARKVLKANWGEQIEYRCSYLHSNMSLDQYTRKMKVQHQKLTGTYDYSKIRFPWTPMLPEEMPYCINDVVGLAEALEVEMEMDGDNLYTIPLTSTGYVRRDARAAMAKAAHSWLPSILPDVDIFQMLREEFAGGNTHANRYYAGQILENVKSADRSSSYPDVQCNRLFPISSFYHAGNISFEELMYLINVRKKAVIMRISITNCHLRDPYWGCPYISRHKCVRCLDTDDTKCAFDNGRVLSAGYLEMTVNDIDLRIILDEYDGEICCYDVAYARYGRLPEELRQVAIDYYKGKTELKGVEGMEVFYTKLKNKLNAIYGMSAQNPAKESVIYRKGEWIPEDTPLEELLEDSNKRAFLSYAWGCWTTSWARWELEQGIKLAGHNFVYCDTDSVKYLGDIDWSAYNEERIRNSRSSGAWAVDPAGTEHYMGVYEQEQSYLRFATLGAKKYAFEYEPGHTLITIAGVTKKEGGKELDAGDEYGHGLERFVDLAHPFTFRRAGGTEAIYQDEGLGLIQIDGHWLNITPNIVIRDSTYTLGITAEYDKLIHTGLLPLDNWATDWYY